MKQYVVRFDERNAIHVTAEDEREARETARMDAWLLTGNWLEVIRIEELKGEQD